MKFYRTNNVVASIRRAHEAFTHVHVHRAYVNARPILVRTEALKDLPIFAWAAWQKEAATQLARWRENGGVLLNRGKVTPAVGPADVMVFFECPLERRYLEQASAGITDQVIIPVAPTWRQHELSVDLRTPSEMQLRALWAHCQGRRMTDQELADLSGVPMQHVMLMRRSLAPQEEWDIRPRLAPESAALLPAWEWAGAGRVASKREVRAAGHKTALREMKRLGHIALTKYLTYPTTPPDWVTLAAKRRKAIEDLDQIRSLVESLPDHLQDG
ncbi:hypothetical protein A3203_32875 [Burkholderia cenocepacia]|uniref:hypothetical protein n=1 Tax=Burkholderia cenocepacia TaxID=95486 RepID=UPI00078B98BA|nr:hypothetical protein [Burkholderia cenocepacia]AMU17572.1 hypothetical protein A3203_32875 [Burkholderia cenocepacia]